MRKTRRLYYEDSFLGVFEAAVLECRRQDGGYVILLDQSAFYPEGGGQPCDLGSLGEAVVTDVQEKDGELLHFTDRPLEAGSTVTGSIDWERRFDLMQQHSGEHIVSGLIHEKYGYNNVGFHMGSDVITIDLDGPLSEEQLSEIELLTNRVIWKNEKVRILLPDPGELASLDYRSKKELTGDVRLVEFPGADLCACCGTHVNRTGEIGMVKILSAVRFREGVRIEMIAGGRVLSYLNQVDRQNHIVSAALSAKIFETGDAVRKMQQENYRLRGEVQNLRAELFEAEAARWENKGDALLFRKELAPDDVRRLCDAVMKRCGGRCAVFAEDPAGGFRYAMGEAGGDLRELTKELNRELDGRGGGKPFFVQGSVKAGRKQIEDFFAGASREKPGDKAL